MPIIKRGASFFIFFLTFFSYSFGQIKIVDSSKGQIEILAINGKLENRILVIEFMKKLYESNNRKLPKLVFENKYFENNIKNDSVIIAAFGEEHKHLLVKYVKKSAKSLKAIEENENNVVFMVFNSFKSDKLANIKIDVKYLNSLSYSVFLSELNKYVVKPISVFTNDISPWVQDVMIVTSENGKENFYVDQSNSDKVITARNLATQLGFTVNETNITLEGGNILFLDSLAFVGVKNKNTIDSTFVYERCTPNIIWVGFKENDSFKQPVFHIDLFMNVFTHEDSLVLIFSKHFKPSTFTDSSFNYHIELSKQKIFSQLSRFIDSNKIIIDSIPIHKDLGINYFYSNAVLEFKNKDYKFVYVPIYKGSKVSDISLITQTFDRYKVKTNFIGNSTGNELNENFTRSMENQGALHCQVKVIKRSTK